MSDITPRHAGRPSLYTPEIAEEICRRLAAGETLRAICRDDHLPAENTVRDWALANLHGFSAQYTRAREIGYHGMADELIDIADEARFDTIPGGEDQPDRQNHEWISRSRLRVDTRKWLLSKALPKIYGDRVDTSVHLLDGNDQPVSAADLARQVAFLLATAMQGGEDKASPDAAPIKH